MIWALVAVALVVFNCLAIGALAGAEIVDMHDHTDGTIWVLAVLFAPLVTVVCLVFILGSLGLLLGRWIRKST